MSSSGRPPISYRPQVNRAITKRWAEAKQISYEGDDWGDDDDDGDFYESTPSSARGAQQSGWPAQNASAQRYGAQHTQQGITPSGRSFTNPSPTRSNDRQSFDRGDEKRNFSAHAHSSSFEGPYPTAQRSPFPEPQHDFHQPYQDPSTRAFHASPPLHVQTHLRQQSRDLPSQGQQSSRDPAQYMRLPSALDPRSAPYQDLIGGVTYGAGEAGRQSESSGRSESPYRTVNPPIAARSQNPRDESPAKRFPPRKSSLGQDTPIPEPSLQPVSSGAGAGAGAASGDAPASDGTAGVKPLPFIRPADIYKRMEEEREKERRSQESSRPSVDSNASRPRDRDIFTSARQSQESSRPKIDAASGLVRDNRSPALVPQTSSHNSESVDGSEDMETTRKPKSTLDPVAERKSEYGFDNMLKDAGPDQPSTALSATSTPAEVPTQASTPSTRLEEAQPLAATSPSSNYSDRPDPVTASSPSSGTSFQPFLPVVRGVSDFGTNILDRTSLPRDNPSPARRPAPEAQNGQSNSPAISGASSSSLQANQDVATVTAAHSNPLDTEIRHSPSGDLRSVTHQTFDDSHSQVPQTPPSMAESVVRLTSASASEISPVVSGTTSSFRAGAGVFQSGSQHPSMAEEMNEAGAPPLQSTAGQPHPLQKATQPILEPALPSAPPPVPVKDGYQRDHSIPSLGNSQARTLLPVGNIDVPEGEPALKSSTTPTNTRTLWTIRGTAPGDSQDFETQTKSIRTKVELQDSRSPTPASTSAAPGGPSSRGTVRELAQKLESRSGRSSPAISPERDPNIPPTSQERLDSFRPSLPGGWQSYSTNTETASLQQAPGTGQHSVEQAGHMQRDGMEDSPVSSEDDDFPTAGPPMPKREDSDYGPSQTTFTAAAAAGSALAGAFTSATGVDSRRNEIPSYYDFSEDDSMNTNSVVRNNVSEKDLANITSQNQGDALEPRPHEEVAANPPIAPSPPAKDTPTEIDTPASTLLGYFPPPLRTNRSTETARPTANEPSSPSLPLKLRPLSSDTSLQGTENDRLRNEIVKGLASNSTRDQGDSARLVDDGASSPQFSVSNEPPSSNVDSTTVSDPHHSNAQRLNIDSEQSKASAPYAPTALKTTDKALPQLNIAEDDRHEPDTSQARTVADSAERPILEQRFSWEAQPETERSEVGQSAESISATLQRTTQGAQGETGSPKTTRPHPQANASTTTSPSRVVPLMAPADTLRHVQDEAPSRYGEPGHNIDVTQQGASAEQSPRHHDTSLRATDSNSPVNASAREMAFRDILLLGTPQDRIQAFNANRGVVASHDTGLEEWLRAMGNQRPEHSDLLRNNGRLSAQENENLASFKPSPARSIFPRFTSVTNSNQSTDPEYDPSISNSPSGGRSSNLHMPGQGKKLLKDAGKIGGQAGVVAKGLFVKGKNKLRAGGVGSGSDKGLLAGRRRSSQPMIVIDEPQHSSVTTNTAPQIPNLNISPIESEDQWYKIDAVSSPVQERSISPINTVRRQESNNRDLMLPGHVDRPLHQIRQSSPRVSAVGSFHDGEGPSRSISDVTRPTNSGDERSPVAPILEEYLSSMVTGNVAPNGSRQSRLVTALPAHETGLAATRVPSAPVSDALGPLPNMTRSANAATKPAMAESSATDRDTSLDPDLMMEAQDQGTRALAPADAPDTPQAQGQPMHSATASGTNPPPSSEHAPQSGVVDSNVPVGISEPSFDGATPPYTEPNLSKEAEAAMYNSQVDPFRNSADGPPAYQSNRQSVQNVPKSRIGNGDAIIPVKDLSHQRQVSSGPTVSRPFSFVAGDTLISRENHTTLERLPTSSDAPLIPPDLAKEISVVSSEDSRDSLDFTNRMSNLYSRPLITDPHVSDHPAYRQSQDMALNKEILNTSRQEPNVQPVTDRRAQTFNEDGQYRIPGPYVQEYRSPRQPPQGFVTQQLPPQTSQQNQPNQRTGPAMDPLRSHNSPAENQMRPPGRSVNDNAVPKTEAVAPAINERPHQQSRGGLLRTRSKSRSIRSRNDEPQDVENKNERRGGFFKHRTKGDGAGLLSQLGSLRGNSVDSRDSLNKQMSRDSGDHDAVHGERADRVGDLNSTRPDSMLRNPSSGNPWQNETRKKRFSGFGSLFSRSSTGGMKTSTKSPGPESVQRASTLSHYLLGKPNIRPQLNAGAPDSMYAQNQQRHQPDQGGNYSASQRGFQGLNAPIAGYYAPSGQQQAERSIMPHGPDSFSRGGFSAEQQTSPGQYRSQNNQDHYQALHQPGSHQLSQQLPSQVSHPEETRPPLHINTNTNQPGISRGLNHHYATAPPGPAPEFPPSQSSPEPPRQVLYYSNQRPTQESPYESRQGSRSPYGYTGTQGTSQNVASHAIDLHKRSRSPRNGRRLSEDERLEDVDRSDPASQLGTFSKSPVPRSGGADSSEQEAPWRIGLPNSEEDEKNQRKSQAALLERRREQTLPQGETGGGNRTENVPPRAGQNEQLQTGSTSPRRSEEESRKQEQPPHQPTVAERVMGVQLARTTPLPLQRSTSTGNAMARTLKMSPVELPGSKAPGDDDSEEEIVMSSTAYPGQEWAPESWGYGGNWDD